MKTVAPVFSSLSFMCRSSVASVMLITASLASVSAAPMDDESQPSPTDPSAYYNPPADPAAALEALKTMPETNQGALALPNGA